jgi:hypothetical protein
MEDISGNILSYKYENCVICGEDIKHYNLCLKNKTLCYECLRVDDMECYCNDIDPCEVNEEIEGNIKHHINTYKIDDDTTIVINRDETYDLHSELKRENEDLKSRLETLEALLLYK